MAITVYSGEGFTNVRSMVADIVRNLLGNGTPDFGTAVPHMRMIFPADYTGDADLVSTSKIVILEARPTMDPFAHGDDEAAGPEHDPWRLAFHMYDWKSRSMWVSGAEVVDPSTAESLAVYAGTPTTLFADGSAAQIAWQLGPFGVSKLPFFNLVTGGQVTPTAYAAAYRPTARDFIEPLGNMGATWTNNFDPTSAATKYGVTPTVNQSGGYESPKNFDGPDVTGVDQLFINRWQVEKPVKQSAHGMTMSPVRAVAMSYRMVVTDHGIFLGCWGPDPEESGSGFSWLLIQRPVDKNDGIVRGLDKTTLQPYNGTQIDPNTGIAYPIGNRPLFCVNSVNGKFYKFIVREHDNPIPSTKKDATRNDRDSGAVINAFQQQSLTENGEYVITFLNNLNTSRFKYSDELDMVGTVSADVVGGGSNIDVSVYSEEQKRTYHALWSSGSYGSKMRIMVVEKIPTPNGGGEGGGGGGGDGALALAANEGSPMTFTVGAEITPVTPVTTSGGTAPYTYAIDPALPDGLSLNTSSAEITGTPTTASSETSYTITVTDSTSATATATVLVTVND